MTTLETPPSTAPGSPAVAEHEAQFAALCRLASLRAEATGPAALLERAAGLAAQAAGCPYGAVVAGDTAGTRVFAAGSTLPDEMLPALTLESGSPTARAMALQQPVVALAGKSGCWIAVPVVTDGSSRGAVLIVGPLPAPVPPPLDFLRAFAVFLAPEASLTLAAMLAGAERRLPTVDVETLLESMRDPFALFDTEGQLRVANSAYRTLLSDAGLPDGPLIAYPDLVVPRDRSGRRVKPGDTVLARALAGRSTHAERVYRLADGRDRTFTVIGNTLRDSSNAIAGAAILLRDASEQVARERALRLMDEVRRGLSLSGDVRHAARAVCRRAVSLLAWVDMAVVFGHDGDTPVFLAQAGFTPRAAALLASTPMGSIQRAMDAVRENRATVFQTDRDEPSSEASRRVIAATGAATFINLPLGAGTQRFGLMTLAAREPHVPARDELALLEALAAQVGAELEGVRRREEAETERSRLQAVLNQLPEGVLLFDAGGRLVMSNRSADDILGRTVDPSTPLVSLAAHYGFLHTDGRTYLPGDEPIARTFSSGRAVLGEEQLVRRADGRDLPIVSNVAPVRDAGGQLAAVIMVFQDITALREMDRLKDEFLSIAGHELRTPITSIRGLAQLLERRHDRLEQETIARALSTITEQTEQMAALVDDLLDMSRIRTGRLTLASQPCDLSLLLRTAVERARPQREGRIRLIAPDSLPACGDAQRLLQVFANLLDNAAKYSEPRAPIDVVARLDRDKVEIGFHDRGIGIPPESLGRLFERFYRAENATLYAGGLGLGLYLCREIVERHGGGIAVASAPAAGTTFTVTLPLPSGTPASD